MSFRYLIISPVRNEAEFLDRTIQSVAGQTILPTEWVIVDDGSTDQTRLIAERAARVHSWITVIGRADRGFRQAGTGVVQAFNEGYRAVKDANFEYLVKLDGDVSFEPNYFERCFLQFYKHSGLGIGGGTVCKFVGGALEPESKVDPVFHVRGATKIYRAECWAQLGGLLGQPGWDTLDEVKANMLGWRTRTFSEIRLIHHRPAGAAYGTWANLLKNGLANYVVGYHPLFMFLKCLRRLAERPYGLAGLGLFTGFVGGYIRRVPQITDAELIRYLRTQQMNRILGKPCLWDDPADCR